MNFAILVPWRKKKKKQSSNQMTTRMSHVGAHISISSAENAMGTRGV